MSFANNYNHKKAQFTYQQIQDAPYAKLRDLWNDGYREGVKAFTIRGAFVNEQGRYGASASFICEGGFNISLPQHMVDEVRRMLQDPDAIQAMNAGTAGGTVYQYKNRNGGDSYGVTYVDIKPAQSPDLPF